MYPQVAAEEVERLYAFLGLSLSDVANCCNETVVYATGNVRSPNKTWQPVTVNMLMYTCLADLFIAIEDTYTKTWADYPAWVRELYDRATACEQFDSASLVAGELVILD